ncbi:MAG TPA: DUF4344 domain-containing metallopeptidase [Pyrinomonadaceae bacterium]
MDTPRQPAHAGGAPRPRRPRRRRLADALLLAALALSLHACSLPADKPGDVNSNAGVATPAASPATTPAQTNAAKAADKGDFKVARHEGGDGLSAKERAEMAEEEKSLEEAAAELNKAFSLPHDIFIGFDACDEPNAFYDPEKKQVTVCYELVADLYEAFRADYKTDEEVDDIVSNATTFVFFHEVGHALVDAYDLPITGREEDAVDQLSVLVLADGTDEGDRTVLDAARSFAGETQEELDELAFADEHSFDRQRFYNIICLLYGQNEQKFASLVEDGTLPEGRAERCADEYARADKAWDALLAPYVK